MAEINRDDCCGLWLGFRNGGDIVEIGDLFAGGFELRGERRRIDFEERPSGEITRERSRRRRRGKREREATRVLQEPLCFVLN